jgi:catechol 2,3-dioxygenase-like lactoylglutathione lyase family enzyme
MKRLHVHVHVEDLAASVRFYASLFGVPPSLLHVDYAKWNLEDPRVNFAISQRGGEAGLDHLGIQVDDAGALAVIAERLTAAGAAPVEQADTTCCYARSDKAWVNDPQGIAWETFVTHEEIAPTANDKPASCCGETSCGVPSETPASAACCA